MTGSLTMKSTLLSKPLNHRFLPVDDLLDNFGDNMWINCGKPTLHAKIGC